MVPRALASRGTRLVLAAYLAILAGCASPRPPTYRAEVVPGLETQGEQDGYAGVLRFSPRILGDRGLCRMVVAHEIGHTLGVPHTPAPSIMASRHGEGETPIEALTRQEVRAASHAPVTVWLPADAPVALREAAAWAERLWNEALGERVVTVLAR